MKWGADMLVEERRRALLEFLQENEVGQLSELADRMGVSFSTVRRDLDTLAQQGYVRRIRGGALYVKPSDVEPPWGLRWLERATEKKLIAAAAAQLVLDDEVVFLDAGSSSLYLAKELRGSRRIMVVTNSLPVMCELGCDDAIGLVALGGEFYHREKYFRGPHLEQELEQMRMDKLFLGIVSIEAERGLSEVHQSEIPLKKAIMKASRQRIVLAHGDKVGRASHFHLCPVSEIDMLVTDATADPAELERLERAGVKVLVAGVEAT